MQMLGLRDSLGGPWATSARGWILLFIPSVVLVTLQDARTAFPSWDVLALSAIAQQLASGLILATLGPLARLRWRILPVPVAFAIWICAGLARGVTSGAIVTAFAAEHPDYFWRIVYWVSISVLWVPLFVYAVAQIEHRRALLGEYVSGAEARDAELERSQHSADDLRTQLIAAVRQAIGPVLLEIQRSLSAVQGRLDPATSHEIGERLAVVSSDAARIVNDLPERDPLSFDESPPSRRAPLSAAIQFDRSRPVLAATLAGLLLLLPALAEALRQLGSPGGTYSTLLVLISIVLLAVTLSAQRALVGGRMRYQTAAVLLAYALAGVGASALIAIGYGGRLNAYELALTLGYPFALIVVSAAVSAAVGVAQANAQLADQVDAVVKERLRLRTISLAESERVREQLGAILHGPVYGRLSACAMALNFHANQADASDDEKTDSITRAVLDHLSAASRELDALSRPANRG